MRPGYVTFRVIGSSFFGNVSNCWLNSYGKFGGATRRCFFCYLRKTVRGGGEINPPAGARVRDVNLSSLGAAVQHNFRRMLPVLSREDNISSLGAAVQHNFRRTLLVPFREENISSLGAAVQDNFRRTLLVPSREENIGSLGAAVQHNFRRMLLVPFREENIKRISIAWVPRYSISQTKSWVSQNNRKYSSE